MEAEIRDFIDFRGALQRRKGRTGDEIYFLNLKRFDIPKELGGVNAIAPIHQWGSYIVENTQEALKAYEGEDVEFAMYFPEAHLTPAVNALCENSPDRLW